MNIECEFQYILNVKFSKSDIEINKKTRNGKSNAYEIQKMMIMYP